MRQLIFILAMALSIAVLPQYSIANPACYCDSACVSYGDCCISPGVCPSGQTCNGVTCVASTTASTTSSCPSTACQSSYKLLSPGCTGSTCYQANDGTSSSCYYSSYEYCPGGCSGGSCISCTAQWTCSGNWVVYQYADCSLNYDQYCSNGCSGGSCIAVSCPSTACWSSYKLLSPGCTGSTCYQANDGTSSSCYYSSYEYCPGGCSGGSCIAPSCSPPACGSGLTCYASACGSSCSSGYTQCLSGSQVVCCNTPSCTAQWTCSGNWVVYQYADCSLNYDQYCSNGCSGGSCITPCACTSGSYAFSSCTACNTRTPYYNDCNCGTYAGTPYTDTSCSSLCCTSHNSYSCSDNDVYWYNSCGTIEDKKEECYDGSGWYDLYRCSPTTPSQPQRRYWAKGCSGNSCYTTTDNWQDWGSACPSGWSCDGSSAVNYGGCSAGSCVESLRVDCNANDGWYSSGLCTEEYRDYTCTGAGSCSSYTVTSTRNKADGTNCGTGQICSSGSCITPICSAPASLACSEADLTQTKLSWSAVTGATNYKVEWCKNTETFSGANCCLGTSCYATPSTTTSNTYATITGLSQGTTYNFRVRVDSASGCNVPGSWSSTQACSTTSGSQCWTSCINAGYNRGECTTWTGSYGCSGDGNDFCYFGRIDNGDQKCGWFTNCWCSNVQNCDSCTLPNPDACTSSGCVPTKLTNADCRTGSCNNPSYDCVYIKSSSGGSGIGSCIVGWGMLNWEGVNCYSTNYLDSCGCKRDPMTYCPLLGSANNKCPYTMLPEGTDCYIRIPCAGGTATTGSGGPCWNTASQYAGKWSKSTDECVECSGTKAVKILGDASAIRVDCSGNALSASRCDAACGANSACDDKAVGACTTSTSLQKCSNSCAPVSSCGDGVVNCGEDCEPPNTAACDANCKSTCVTSCSNAKNLGSGSISIGGYEASYTCGISSSNTQDWLKITASNNGKLKIELTPPAGYDYDLYVYANDCSTSLCSSVKTGDAVDSCTIDAAATTTYKVKISRYSGSGAAAVSAYLEECFVDSNCPSAKPYCSSNVCVQCLSDANCGFTAGNIKRKCDCPLAGCGQNDPLFPDYTCTDPTTCGTRTGVNEECAPGYCCTGETPQGPGKPSSSTCKPLGDIQNPWLCT